MFSIGLPWFRHGSGQQMGKERYPDHLKDGRGKKLQMFFIFFVAGPVYLSHISDL